MANEIRLKRGSGSDPSASDLVTGEVAIRTDNGKLFTKKDDGTVAEISGSGGGGGVTSDAQQNTLGGTDAGASFSGTSAFANTLFGYEAGTGITTGDYNTAFGQKALYSTTTASYNVAIGPSALF